MTTTPQLFEADSVSKAWSQAFVAACGSSRHEIAPLVVSVTGFDSDGVVANDPRCQGMVDECIASLGVQLTCEEVASTIFPESLWDPRGSRQEFFNRFRDALPGIIHVRRGRKRPNKRGTYFQRMWSFREPLDRLPMYAPFPDEYMNPPAGRLNQLEHVIQMHLKARERGAGARRSGLQAAIFDPMRDQLESPYLPFPCLHHVAFLPDGESLNVVGYYGLQYLIQRAYGNYLGLSRLGRFMANEMGLVLKRVTCIAGVGTLDFTKTELASLEEGGRVLYPEMSAPTVAEGQ